MNKENPKVSNLADYKKEKALEQINKILNEKKEDILLIESILVDNPSLFQLELLAEQLKVEDDLGRALGANLHIMKKLLGKNE